MGLIGSKWYSEQNDERQCKLHIMTGFPEPRVQPALIKLFQPENVEQQAKCRIDKSFVLLVRERGKREDALEEEDCFSESATGCVCDCD